MAAGERLDVINTVMKTVQCSVLYAKAGVQITPHFQNRGAILHG